KAAASASGDDENTTDAAIKAFALLSTAPQAHGPRGSAITNGPINRFFSPFLVPWPHKLPRRAGRSGAWWPRRKARAAWRPRNGPCLERAGGARPPSRRAEEGGRACPPEKPRPSPPAPAPYPQQCRHRWNRTTLTGSNRPPT